MPALTPEQNAYGLAQFLARAPDLKRQIDALTEREADCLGVSLEEFRRSKTQIAIAEAAQLSGEDNHEFFLRFVAKSEEEYAVMVAANRASIQAALVGE